MTQFIILAWSAMSTVAGCVSIGPGKVGVLWTAGGGTRPEVYSEGSHSSIWWNTMYVYDVRIMSRDEMLSVIASNGLAINLDASIQYRLISKEIVALHSEIGPDYYQKILEPILRSEARSVIGRYTPEEIYSTKRDIIEREIREGLRTKIEGRHIELEAVLIRNVELPEAIRHAIDEKLTAEQEVLKMKYVLEVARAESERKKIEAGGIADYNREVAGSLTPSILEFSRIQQLSHLATSPNSKTVIMGSGVNSSVLLSSASPDKQKTQAGKVE